MKGGCIERDFIFIFLVRGWGGGGCYRIFAELHVSVISALQSTLEVLIKRQCFKSDNVTLLMTILQKDPFKLTALDVLSMQTCCPVLPVNTPMFAPLTAYLVFEGLRIAVHEVSVTLRANFILKK